MPTFGDRRATCAFNVVGSIYYRNGAFVHVTERFGKAAKEPETLRNAEVSDIFHGRHEEASSP